VQKQFGGGRMVFSINGLEQSIMGKIMNLDLNFIPYTKIDSKHIMDLGKLYKHFRTKHRGKKTPQNPGLSKVLK